MPGVLDITHSGLADDDDVNGILELLEQRVTKTIAFSGAAGNGAVGNVPLFTVTGDVLVRVIGVVTETLAGASATLTVGTANNTAGILASVTATQLAAGDLFLSGGTPAEVGDANSTALKAIGQGADIIAAVGTANITDGTIRFYCLWRPLSSDGNVVAV